MILFKVFGRNVSFNFDIMLSSCILVAGSTIAILDSNSF